jgi:hypothetical protein
MIEAARLLVRKKKLVLIQGVKLKPQGCVPNHPHKDTDVVLYMPMTHPTPLVFHDPEITFPTEAGWAVYIPARQWHEVLLNDTLITRYTIAVLFS